MGPILAAMYFGWGPTWIWILVGAILVGGVHDFRSTLMSVRNGGRSRLLIRCEAWWGEGRQIIYAIRRSGSCLCNHCFS